MSIYYDQAQNRRAYRERQRQINDELTIPSLSETAEWDKTVKIRKEAKTELDKYCADVDKDMNVYDLALFNAAKIICQWERYEDPDHDPTLAEISKQRDYFYDRAYDACRAKGVHPTQIAPDLNEDSEPAFHDEAAATQRTIFDALKETEEEKAAKNLKLVVAPEERKCVCGERIEKATPNPLINGIIFAFKCGSLLDVNDTGEEYITICPTRRITQVDAEVVEETDPEIEPDELAALAEQFAQEANEESPKPSDASTVEAAEATTDAHTTKPKPTRKRRSGKV